MLSEDKYICTIVNQLPDILCTILKAPIQFHVMIVIVLSTQNCWPGGVSLSSLFRGCVCCFLSVFLQRGRLCGTCLVLISMRQQGIVLEPSLLIIMVDGLAHTTERDNTGHVRIRCSSSLVILARLHLASNTHMAGS